MQTAGRKEDGCVFFLGSMTEMPDVVGVQLRAMFVPQEEQRQEEREQMGIYLISIQARGRASFAC